MSYKEVVSYSSGKMKMSRYRFAREVLRSLEVNESTASFKYKPGRKHIFLRHELCHHIPLEDYEAEVKGMLKENNGKFTHSCVSIEHYQTPPLMELFSSLAPLFLDRKYIHELSLSDIQSATQSLRKAILGL